MDYKELMKHLNKVMIMVAEEVVFSNGRDVEQAAKFVWSLYSRKLVRDGNGHMEELLQLMFIAEVDKVYGKEVLV